MAGSFFIFFKRNVRLIWAALADGHTDRWRPLRPLTNNKKEKGNKSGLQATADAMAYDGNWTLMGAQSLADRQQKLNEWLADEWRRRRLSRAGRLAQWARLLGCVFSCRRQALHVNYGAIRRKSQPIV
jgi:hypothetical protein